jgi:hypothetical protein
MLYRLTKAGKPFVMFCDNLAGACAQALVEQRLPAKAS